MNAIAGRPTGLFSSWRGAATFAVLAIGALVLASRSFGAVTPHLVVSSVETHRGQTLTISASRQKADDPIGRLQVYVPSGFALDSPANGLTVGTATATVVMRDSNPTAAVALHGTVVAIPITDTALAYESSNCDGNQHLAAWMVHLKGSKGTFSFPVFVDAPTGTAASFGPYDLVACFRPADTAATDPNRSPGGTVLDSLTLSLKHFARPTTSGAYRWRSLWTPFAAGTGSLNEAGNVEAQSIVDIPTGQIVIFGKKSTVTVHGKSLVLLTISGRVLVGGEPQGLELVTIRHGATPTKLVSLGSAKAGTDGGYTKIVTLTSKVQYFQASTDLRPKDLGSTGCQASFANVPCLGATAGAGRTISGTMLVKR